MKKTYLPLIALVLIGFSSFAQWELLTSGVTESLNSVYFVDPNTGYAVGNQGTILKTNDGGGTWYSQFSGTDQELIYVGSPEANTIFVLAVNGMILKTTNGGISWGEQLPGTDFNLSSAFHKDEATIFAVGSHWDSDVILSSTNGGSWNVQYSVLLEWSVVWLTSVYFSDANTGYVAGGKAHANQTAGILLKTTDGGLTWDYLPGETTPLNSVYFTDNETGFIAGGHCNQVGCYSKIQKTTDGGTTWTDQAIPLNTEMLNSVSFPDTVTGYAAGDNGTILKTTDEGATWNFQSSDATQNLNSIYFFDVNMGFIVGVNGTILKTTNGGGPLRVSENNKMNELSIFPNPAAENLAIELPESGSEVNGIVIIYSMAGQELIRQHFHDSKTEINVALLPKGIYLASLINKENSIYGKFVKE